MIRDLSYNLAYNWPGTYAPLLTVRLLCMAANVARALGRHDVAASLAVWSWEVADVPTDEYEAACELHYSLVPWRGRGPWV